MTARLSYWQIFRLIFVLFSLYVVGEIFYRGEGLTYYYASFSKFIPTAALVTIFYSIVAVFYFALIWLMVRIIEWLILRIGWKLKIERWLLFAGIFILLISSIWTVKEYIVYHSTTLEEKRIVFLCLSISLSLISVTVMFSKKGERWIRIIQKKITPLVWLFGIIVVLSMLLVAYHAL